jgi:hypothetical protein
MPLLLVAILLLTLRAGAVDHARFFEAHCVDCHGPDRQKADLRLDQLGIPSKETTDTWNRIVVALRTGDMPPRNQTSVRAADREAFVNWAAGELARRRPGRPGIRRLNRVEYENTVHDLLGIDTPLTELLPEDNPVQGFDNVADGLGISSILMERYLEAADAAFEGVFRRVKPLPPTTRRVVLMDQKENLDSVKGKKGGVLTRDGAFVDFTPGWPPARTDPAHPIEEGVYRCRIAIFPHEPGEQRTLSVAVFTGPLFGDGKRHFQGMFDATGTPQNPRIIEFTTRMGELHALHILPWIYPEHVTWRDKHEQRPGVATLWAETYGPLDQDFPSPAQRRLFGDSPTLSMPEGGSFYIRHRRGVRSHYVESSAPKKDAARIIHAFVPRAFRRPVDPALTDQFVQLTLARLDTGSSFENAVRAGVSAVLCSPHFLLLNREPEVDDHTIASRLSYFLWSSMPDDELLRLAETGRLADPQVRHAQVERMLDDPRRERFISNFTGQWLDLRQIEFTTPDKNLYPEFDELLQRSMIRETRGFFRHILTNNLSVLNFVDSDFAVLNQRLADHYGIPGVPGHEQFRVVPLPEDSVRGGVLTHASVLKVTANGTSTSPVIRGVWVLDHLLGQPSPPPPAGIPAVEPDIRGATTIRQQLDQHRSIEACARCHTRIDPPGFAMEQFDVIGGERAFYRAMGGKGKRVGKHRYQIGPDVEKGGSWHDGREFDDFREFRAQMLEQKETIARAVAAKLIVYGSGRPVVPADEPAVRAVAAAAREDNYGLRSLIHAVIESEPFLRP